MNPLKLIPAPAVLLVVAVICVATGWLLNGWRLGEQLSRTEQAHNATLAALSAANTAALREQQALRLKLEKRLAVIDTESHQELTDAQAENDRLRGLYSDAGNELKRLRIEVKVARADATVSAATRSSSMGDGARVELSDSAGRAVWDIRAGIKRDQAKLKYLQEYAKHVSQHPSP